MEVLFMFGMKNMLCCCQCSV